METIQSIALTERCTELPMFFKLIDKLVRPLTNQLMDLRSAVTKEASNTVRVMVQTLGEDFKPLATKFMHSSALFKLV
jgi:excinuclease UvrABC helicase subunit UvrB